MIRKLILILMVMIGGCDMQDKNDEIANKSEYSVLQSYEYNYREAKIDKQYMIFKRALNTGATVVAFPIKNKSHGYVVILDKFKKSTISKVYARGRFRRFTRCISSSKRPSLSVKRSRTVYCKTCILRTVMPLKCTGKKTTEKGDGYIFLVFSPPAAQQEVAANKELTGSLRPD